MILEEFQVLSARLDLDQAARAARVRAGIAAYEFARADGLCHAGARECALEAMRAPQTRPEGGEG